MGLFVELVYKLETGEDEYTSIDNDNPYLIAAIQNVLSRTRDGYLDDIMLYTFSVPLGKTYIIKHDAQHGYYPVIIDV